MSRLTGGCTMGNVKIKSKCSRFLDSHSKLFHKLCDVIIT